MPLLLNVETGFSAPHLMQTRVSIVGRTLERQSKALRVDLGMDVPGQVVMLLSQTEPNRKRPLYKPGKAATLWKAQRSRWGVAASSGEIRCQSLTRSVIEKHRTFLCKSRRKSLAVVAHVKHRLPLQRRA